MIHEINRQNFTKVQNRVFSRYISTYLDIYDDFMVQIAGTGLEIAGEEDLDQVDAAISRLKNARALFRNDDKSIYIDEGHVAGVELRPGIREKQTVQRKKAGCPASPDTAQVDVDRLEPLGGSR